MDEGNRRIAFHVEAIRAKAIDQMEAEVGALILELATLPADYPIDERKKVRDALAAKKAQLARVRETAINIEEMMK